MCVFARQDLTRDPPFSHLDLICCRNVLIYMDTPLQRRLLSMFHYALKPEGFLVLGHAESIGYHSDLFAVMNKKHKVYRKKAGATTAPHMDVFRSPFKPESAAPGGRRARTKPVLSSATRTASSWSGTRRRACCSISSSTSCSSTARPGRISSRRPVSRASTF